MAESLVSALSARLRQLLAEPLGLKGLSDTLPGTTGIVAIIIIYIFYIFFWFSASGNGWSASFQLKKESGTRTKTQLQQDKGNIREFFFWYNHIPNSH